MSDARSPGWYDDPAGDADRLRWWDGAGWTGITRERASFEQPPPPAVTAEPEFGGDDVLDSGRPARARPGWVLVLVGVGVVALLVLTGAFPGLDRDDAPADRAAPGLTAAPSPPPTTTPAPRPVSGRITDNEAGLSYPVLPGEWRAWDRPWFSGFASLLGYYRITETDTPVGPYWANVNSGLISPATTRDDLAAAAVRLAGGLAANNYPEHTRRNVESRATEVDGRRAHLLRYVAVFDPVASIGYMARTEAVTVLVVDTGRPLPAALYVSLPDTVRPLWSAVDGLVASVRVLPR